MKNIFATIALVTLSACSAKEEVPVSGDTIVIDTTHVVVDSAVTDSTVVDSAAH